jgi:hypothetical protein
MLRCPGQDQRFWKPDDVFDVKCPNCGRPVEFFKDEPKINCKSYGQMVVNPKIDLGCAQWCRYAQQCLGAAALKDLNIVCDKLIDEMKKVFGTDTKRINHALAVLDYAQKIQIVEGGDPLVVKAAAILHDIGIHSAESKYGSSSGKYQEIEGPPIARSILKIFAIDEQTIEHICKIIANHHSAKNIDTTEFRIIWDADQLVNIHDEFPDATRERLEEIINKVFKTCTGRQIAVEALVKINPIKN